MSRLTPRSGSAIGRRDALRIGGTTLSLAAIVVACGDDRTGDSDPGRVGLAPLPTVLPEFEVDDAVLLRTAASLENTVVSVHATARELGVFDGSFATIADRAVANHSARASAMNDLAVAAGGTAWDDVNPWYVERSITPILDAVGDSDDAARDAINLAITLENLLAATYQEMASTLTSADARAAALEACAQSGRHSAALVLAAFGVANRFSPALVGEEATRTAAGVNRQYAIPGTFGQLGQFELVAGPQDVNGVRSTFLLATPAANSYIYNELSGA
ncbi:MAG: hypothetical protein HKN44_05110 [Ilumatobacter sp.]|nr:hypothetical protein [Ilumatobacter sp.]